MNSVEQSLLAFSKREITGHAAVRAMAEGDQWYVPAPFLFHNLHRESAEQGIMLSTEFPSNPRQLILFSSAEAVNTAHGRPYGMMSGPLSGAEIFAALREDQFAEVEVNPGSPRELTFYMENSTFAVMRQIAATVQLEQALALAETGGVPLAGLKAHSGYVVPVTTPDRQVLSVELKSTPGQFALAFTAADRFELYAKATGSTPATVSVTGEVLFTELGRMNFDGVLLNLGCPKYVMLPASFFPHILSAGSSALVEE
jgi:hypothetical protein